MNGSSYGAQILAATHIIPVRDAGMGLYRKIKRRRSIPPAPPQSGSAGTAASVRSSAQQQQTVKPVKFNHFEAEVEACGLKDDWNQERLGWLFKAFDIDGNGQLEQGEFNKSADQVTKLLLALRGKADFSKPTPSAVETHTQLMLTLGKKEENVMKYKLVEGVPEVEFGPTYFSDSAKAVKNPTLPEGRQSWGFTTDFKPFEELLFPKYKELKEGTMALATHSGPKPDVMDKQAAIQVADDIRRSFWTTVLATVRVEGWRAPWMLMVLHLILVSYPTCSELYLNALKGGPACDCEIGFIRTVMRGLGFECMGDGYFDAESKQTYFSWRKERPGGAKPFYVYLTVHHDPDGIDVKDICSDLHPHSFNATAPNQRRLAVVSAPVADGRGERADEKLNAALGEALKMMKARAEEKGFKDNPDYTQSSI